MREGKRSSALLPEARDRWQVRECAGRPVWERVRRTLMVARTLMGVSLACGATGGNEHVLCGVGGAGTVEMIDLPPRQSLNA